MTPDFTPYLMAGEQIMWQGESHKEGPPMNPKETGSTRLFGIIWTIMTSMMFIPIIFLTEDLKGSALLASIAMAVIFIGVGIGLIVYSGHYKHEYYCLTDRRFLVLNDSMQISNYDFCHIRSAQISGIKNGYGSILMYTDIIHRTRTNGHYHSHHVSWGMRGIENPSECYRILTSLLIVNEDSGLI